jgi:bifunctional DNase/RNase
VLVQMELARIIISEINDQQVVFLREVEVPASREPRSFPILIGIFEATSIDRRVQGNVPQRPLTHDLLKNVVEQLGGEVQDIVITNLVDHTYYATIRIRKEGELIEIDSRPSDALALSVHYEPHLPIYVSEDVLGEVT